MNTKEDKNKEIEVQMRTFDYDAYQARMKNGDSKSIVSYRGKRMTLAQARRAQKIDGILSKINSYVRVCGPYVLVAAVIIGLLTWLFSWPYSVGVGAVVAVFIFFLDIPTLLKLGMMLAVVVFSLCI